MARAVKKAKTATKKKTKKRSRKARKSTKTTSKASIEREELDYDPPSVRRLQIYALDPSLETKLETAVINRSTISVPWERLAIGPIGEYLEIIDIDPASRYVYRPVDLEHGNLLAQDGFEPSEGNPQFHQQMVYAVCMLTIKNFERALGRQVIWAPREYNFQGKLRREYVHRLRIYPHGLRDANAYYSPVKKALLFGYFPADPADPGCHLPGGMVFTCLSHDIVAHETTHALLDGVHPLFITNTNDDVLAFHEAFADIVALFQHFSMKDVVAHQIAKSAGDLKTPNLLGELASQFGLATGSRGALRDYIGKFDEQTGTKWQRHEPNPLDYQVLKQVHARGALLVAAIFDAFIAIYEKRSADLLRLSSGGTGILQQGALHPDLVVRLADEASKTAKHLLTICIRALDYCPPFDITFGEYLRALITADMDLVPDDDLRYRVALVEAFRRRGIYPRGIRTLSEASLKWNPPWSPPETLQELIPRIAELQKMVPARSFASDRKALFEFSEEQKRWFQRRLVQKLRAVAGSREFRPLFRDLGVDPEVRRTSRKTGEINVNSLRAARRIGPDGRSTTELIACITQRRPLFLSSREYHYPAQWSRAEEKNADAWFYGGSTVLVDVETGAVRYAICKNINSRTRMKRQALYQMHATGRSLRATYFGDSLGGAPLESFALMHHANVEDFDYE